MTTTAWRPAAKRATAPSSFARSPLRSLVCSYVRGLLVKENLPRFGEGDRVGFMINFARNQVSLPFAHSSL
jgi:hypothetical protein